MTENPTSSTNPSTSGGSSQKSIIISQIQDLRKILLKETDILKSKSNDELDKSRKQAVEMFQNIEKAFLKSASDYEAFTVDQLDVLRESLEIQIKGFREYVNTILEEDELKLVNSMETTFTNISAITGTQVENIKGLVNKVDEIASKSAKRSVEIVKERDSDVREALSEEIKANKDELSSKITELQDNFRDEMNSKIENVFMGVTMTKEGINGIIRDTLSRLEENLNRLTEGIDENFTKEVGQAQDLIHEYEGRLLKAIEDTQIKYDEHMEQILKRHSQKTQSALSQLSLDLQNFKGEILSELSGLNKEQERLFAGATKQLEDQIAKSKADVIESHGTLRDEMEKLLSDNKESINETVTKFKTTSKTNIEKIERLVSEQVNQADTNTTKSLTSAKKMVETSTNTMQDHIKTRISQAEDKIGK